jgi:hypothetical protein
VGGFCIETTHLLYFSHSTITPRSFCVYAKLVIPHRTPNSLCLRIACHFLRDWTLTSSINHFIDHVRYQEISVYALLWSTPLPQCLVCTAFIYTVTTLCLGYPINNLSHVVAPTLGNSVFHTSPQTLYCSLVLRAHANTSCLF